MSVRLFFTLFAFTAVVSSSSAYAFGYSSEAKEEKTQSEKTIEQVIVDTVFNDEEKAIIEEFFGKQASDKHKEHKKDKKHKRKHKDKGKHGLPPGLEKNIAKRGELPPGLQKKLDETGHLPPGLEKDLPDDLLSRLPARKGTRRVIVDNDIVLIEAATRKVLDVLVDVITE